MAFHLFVHDSVLELREFGAVPTTCCTYEVTGDALQLVDLGALAVRALFKAGVRIFKSAVHATVAVVVH